VSDHGRRKGEGEHSPESAPGPPEAPRPTDAEPPAEAGGADAAHARVGDAAPVDVAIESGAPDAPVGRIGRVVETTRARLVQFTVVAAFAIGAFVIGLIVFNYLLMPGLIHSKAEVQVPNLQRVTLEQAESILATHGLQISRAGERFDPDVPRGFVISQDPPPGAPVRRQKTVRVVVSLGEEFSSVPSLFGESRRSAEQLLQSAGLALGTITRAPSEDVGEGLVLASDPPAESVLPRDTPVSLLVSAGGGERAFLMPDLLGREIGRARSQLEAFGLQVRVPGISAPVGAIVYQQPRPGARVSARDTVVLQAIGRLIR
jgi:beta-lactam-binding protein with PASTA domain